MFLELSSECISWVELRIGVKHVAFLVLSSEWHPSSWAWDGRWTQGTLELSLGWRVLPVWVCWLWPVQMGPDRLPSSVVADEFGSLGTLRLCSYLGTPPGVTVCDPWHGFSHVLYWLWPICMAANHLEVITRKCRTRITWLWLCDMESNGGISLGWLYDIYENKCYIYIYICLFY